jgi:hypothetical protein
MTVMGPPASSIDSIVVPSGAGLTQQILPFANA